MQERDTTLRMDVIMSSNIISISRRKICERLQKSSFETLARLWHYEIAPIHKVG